MSFHFRVCSGLKGRFWIIMTGGGYWTSAGKNQCCWSDLRNPLTQSLIWSTLNVFPIMQTNYKSVIVTQKTEQHMHDLQQGVSRASMTVRIMIARPRVKQPMPPFHACGNTLSSSLLICFTSSSRRGIHSPSKIWKRKKGEDEVDSLTKSCSSHKAQSRAAF